MFKKIGLIILLIFCLSNFSYACIGDKCETDSNVQDSNDGNKGYIFTYDCEKGNVSVGQWVDPKDVPELRGEKGDTGSQGEQGIAGQNGKDGQNGETGATGADGAIGETGQDGKDGAIGETGQDGKNGEQGIQGLSGKGLEDRIEIIGEVRVFDTKKWSGFIYAGTDVNNNISIIGAKLQYKIGRSYEEKRLDELEKKINTLLQTSLPNAEFYTDGTKIGIREKF